MASQLMEAIHTNLQLLEFDEFIRKESKSKNMGFMRDIMNTP
jgi:NurA-like 5'-3' nuclease